MYYSFIGFYEGLTTLQSGIFVKIVGGYVIIEHIYNVIIQFERCFVNVDQMVQLDLYLLCSCTLLSLCFFVVVVELVNIIVIVGTDPQFSWNKIIDVRMVNVVVIIAVVRISIIVERCGIVLVV